MRSEREWQNHPVHALLLRQKIGEPGRRHRRRGDTIIFFQSSGVFGDRRRAAISATDAEDYGVTPPFQLSPEIRLVRKHVSRLPHHGGLHRRHPPRKPSLHLFKKFIGAAKAYIHQVDCLAVERAKTWGQWRRLYRVSCPSHGVQNCIERFALSHESSSENQPRRNEGNEEKSEKTFALFVSSWLIFIVSVRRSPRHERLLRKSSTKKRRKRRKVRKDFRALRFFVVDFHCFSASHAAT